MQPLIELLGEYFIYVVFIGIWLLSMAGGAIAKAARKAEQQRRAAERQQGRTQAPGQAPGQQGQRPAGPTARSLTPQQRAQPTVSPTAQPRPQPRAQPTADEIAAEIRRVMGMEEAPRPAPVRQPVAPPPPPEPDPISTPVSRFEHFGERVGGLRSGVDPHVGESVKDRHAPTSGAVGARELGSLGGSYTRVKQAPVKRRVTRFDLSDPAAVLVTLEILGPPRALRDFQF